MTDPSLAPMLLTPRLDAKPWGGRRLAEFGFALPPETLIGEAVITAPEAMVLSEDRSPGTLGDLVAAWPEAVIGRRGLAVTGGRAIYPVLLKLIDAQENLSIQVHPDDAAAAPGQLGKTETYYVLSSAPGAAIALGLRPEVTAAGFAATCRSGQPTTGLLRWLPACAGEAILIPAGTVHALGAGCLVFEAQQPSEVTFRLDDWGRLGTDGQPRELHCEAGLAVYDPLSRPVPRAPLLIKDPAGGPTRHIVTACRYFAVERLDFAGETLTLRSADSPQTFTVLSGTARIATVAGAITAAGGQSALVTARVAETTISAARASVLRAWVPDLLTDIVTPALAAGVPPAAIGGLAGALPDLRRLLAEHG